MVAETSAFTHYVRRLALLTYNRAAYTPDEEARWAKLAASSTSGPANLVAHMENTSEAIDLMLAGWCQGILQTDVMPVSLKEKTVAIFRDGGTDEDIMAAIIDSPFFLETAAKLPPEVLPPGDSQTRFVQSVYLCLLCRLPEPNQLEALRAMDGQDRLDMIKQILCGREYRSLMISMLWANFLRRQPALAELRRVLDSRWSLRRIRQHVFSSPEFFAACQE